MLARAQAKQDKAAARASFRDGLAATIGVMLPVSLMFVWGADVIVRTAFERGAFDASASERTAYALVLYAAGMVPQALIVYLNRAFFAVQNTRTPMIVGLVSVVIHLAANVVLVDQIGYAGIALGTTIYGVIYAVLLLANLHKANLENAWAAIISLWRIILGAILAYGWLWIVPANSLSGFLLCCSISTALYVMALVFLREPLTKRLQKW